MKERNAGLCWASFGPGLEVVVFRADFYGSLRPIWIICWVHLCLEDHTVHPRLEDVILDCVGNISSANHNLRENPCKPWQQSCINS